MIVTQDSMDAIYLELASKGIPGESLVPMNIENEIAELKTVLENEHEEVRREFYNRYTLNTGVSYYYLSRHFLQSRGIKDYPLNKTSQFYTNPWDAMAEWFAYLPVMCSDTPYEFIYRCGNVIPTNTMNLAIVREGIPLDWKKYGCYQYYFRQKDIRHLYHSELKKIEKWVANRFSSSKGIA